jgi:hypothetical protein
MRRRGFMPSPVEIAEGLTPGQRDAIVGPLDKADRHTLNTIVGRGLAEWDIYPKARLTPLGRQVAQVLEDSSG